MAEVGETASWASSVCRGSLILEAAGLLKGYKATSHWAMIDDLKYFGAIPVHERVVIDGNRMTGAGISSGIDFGLTLLSVLQGKEAAKAKQLVIEYDPDPPFKEGHPKAPTPKYLITVSKEFAAYIKQLAPNARKSLEKAATRLM